MPLIARRDPRLDPRLKPEEWAPARRLYRNFVVAGLLLLILAAGAGGYYYPRLADKTRGLQPAQVVEAAGMAIARATAYGFVAELTGESSDGFFPNAVMKGAYQRQPLVLHLAGETGSGEHRIPLEYYLEGQDLYVKNPRSDTWMLVKEAKMDELYAFQPDNLAAPLVTGLLSAEAVGRERLPGGEAIIYKLNLDPKVLRLQPPEPGERVEYRLWVYPRTLLPAQFTIEMARAQETESRQTTSFRYQIRWDFGETNGLAVPGEVKKQAAP